MKNKSLLMTVAILTIVMSSAAQESGTFTDSRDSKTYKTVTIGTQTWMAENLAYKVSSGCWAYNKNDSNITTYGYLYNFEAAKNVCPAGWHLPSDAEWTKLTTYLGADSIAGGKMKEAGTTHWISPNTGADNSSGFTALPGGIYRLNGTFVDIDKYGYWWCSTEEGTINAYYRNMDYENSKAGKEYGNKNSGFSVRCIKDQFER